MFRRPLNRTLLIMLATIVASLSLVVTVSAQVPPASRPFGITKGTPPPPPECSVGVDISTASRVYRLGNTGGSGDTYLIRVTIGRYNGAGKVGLVVSQLMSPDNIVNAGTIDDSSKPNQMDIITSVDGRMELRTHDALAVGQTLSTVLAFKLKDVPELVGPDSFVKFTASIDSLNADNSKTVGCSDVSGELYTKVGSAVQFDTEARIKAQPVLIHSGETTTITGSVLNALTSRDDIPANVGLNLTMTYPSTLVLDSGSALPPNNGTTATSLSWQATTGPSGLKKGEFLPGGWLAGFKKSSTAYVAEHEVKFCVTAPAGSWTRQHEKDGGIDAGNNCATVILRDSPLVIKKTWTDNSTTRKVLQPDSTVGFTITVQNNSPATVSNVVLTDTLQRTEACNGNVFNGCPAWDETVAWAGTPAGATIESKSELRIALPPLAAGATQTYTVNVKVASADALIAIMAVNNNGQDRCNKASANLTTAGTSYNERTYVCFNFAVEPTVEVNKTVSSPTVKQGAKASYTITNKNTHVKNPAIGTDLVDTQTDPKELTRWESDAALATKNLKVNADNRHVLESIDKFTINPGATATFNPNFYVVCDAYDRTAPSRDVKNYATFKSQNQTDAKKTPEVPFEVVNGHYNLTADISGTPTQVTPGDPSKNKVAITVKLRNTDTSPKVDLAVPDITWTTTVPSEFTIDMDSINAMSQSIRPVVDGNTLKWPLVSQLDVNGSLDRQFNATIRDNTLRNIPLPTFIISAESASAGSSCGRATKKWNPNIIAPELISTKKVETPVSGIANPGDTVRFSLNISNISADADMNRTNAADLLTITDPLADAFDYTDNPAPTCTLTSRSSGATSGCNVKPTNANDILSWKVGVIARNTTLSLGFSARINSGIVAKECPTPIYNSGPTAPTTITDPLAQGAGRVFGPAVINIYPEQCLQGNIYAKGVDVNNKGIKITSNNLIIDANTVLSAQGSIACGSNQSCVDSAYKFGSYTVDNSVGLNLNAVVGRMRTNIGRVLKNATPPTSTIIAGSPTSYDLFAGKLATDYPEGRVYQVAGDLTLETNANPINFKGKGTFIICGNLNVTGNGVVKTETENAKSAVGFIVLPRTDCPFATGVGTGGGNITIGGDVTKFAGFALYAPGTNGTSIDTNSQSGIISFAGPGTGQLRPAEGLFIAREFSISRSQAVFRYRKSLNTPEGSPPGFTFTSSPNDTNEGR